MDIEKLIRKNVRQLKPYASARDEFDGVASIFLDANENPFPTDVNRYPDPHQQKLKQRISELKKIDAKKIFLGNGSDEPIDLLFRAFCEPGNDEVLIPHPTYGMYEVSASINNVKVNWVSLTNDFDLVVEDTLSLITEKTKLIFLCSPNNPSGNSLTAKKVIEVIENFNGLIVVDEAYIDFSTKASYLDLLDRYDNLVVLQTLSKAWGLAGIRLGMCFANSSVIDVLNKIKPPYNISSLTQKVALSTLAEEGRKNKLVRDIINERKVMEAGLADLNVVETIYPSDANFLLVRVKNAKQVYTNLLNLGIVVRDRSTVRLCENCLRITIGTPNENRLLLDELKKL